MVIHEKKYPNLKYSKRITINMDGEDKIYLKMTEQTCDTHRSIVIPISYEDLFIITARLNGAVRNLQQNQPIE